MQKTADKYCICLTRRFVAIIAAIVTLLKIIAQSTYQSLMHVKNADPQTPSDSANFAAFMTGQMLQLLVTVMLIVAIWKENANMMWPYLCWLSLNLLLEGFGCLILLYTNTNQIPKIAKELVVYGISLSMSMALIYFTNTYEKELRRKEVKPDGITAETDSNA